MFVLGFQEIVPLTAQQIVQTDPEKRFVEWSGVTGLAILTHLHHDRRVWETRLMDVFDRRGNKTCDYVLLRSEQVELILCCSLRMLIVFPARGNCLDDFCQVRADLRYTECGSYNPEGGCRAKISISDTLN